MPRGGSLTGTVGGSGGRAADDLLEFTSCVGAVDRRVVARAADGLVQVLTGSLQPRDLLIDGRDAIHDEVLPSTSVRRWAAHQDRDLVELQAAVATHQHERQRPQVFVPVRALSAGIAGWPQQPTPLVVAQRRSAHTETLGHLSHRQARCTHNCQLDMNRGLTTTVPCMPRHRVLWLDLPVAALLLLSWFTIPAAALHIGFGALFAVAATTHLVIKRGRLRVLRNAPHRRLRLRYGASVGLVVLMVATTASGAAQWADIAVGPMTAAHAATSFGVFVLAGWHVWTRRRVLRHRLRDFARPAPAGAPA